MIFPITFLVAAFITLTMGLVSVRIDKGFTYFLMSLLFLIMMVISFMILGIHTLLTN